ncbi:unnamed protein product [Musa acuminata subsp. burmannicoides]
MHLIIIIIIIIGHDRLLVAHSRPFLRLERDESAVALRVPISPLLLLPWSYSDAFESAAEMTDSAFLRLLFSIAIWCIAYAVVAVQMSIRLFNFNRSSLT